MVTPLQSAGIDPTRIQSQRLQPRNETGVPGAASETATSEDVRVSISAQARAFETSARTAAPTQSTPEQTPAPDGAAPGADPVQASVGVRRANVTEGAASTPPSAGEGAIAERAVSAADNSSARAAAPDGASNDRSEATRLYLANAALPGTPPAPLNGLRTSA
ncbi:MAG: hypothetical protein KJZ96_07895 [Rhodocyclaceae bacterium]|jgi:hypothetical protein|nr:hypothetical protein [Rhodocyclaceae bacterium]MCL4758256.1 hypothetical protein [Rhodocyclaceae bacterium]